MIGEIKQTPKLAIRVSQTEFKGNKYVDIRKHFLNDKSEWIPMRKGIAIPLSQLSDAITLLEKAEAQIQGAKQ